MMRWFLLLAGTLLLVGCGYHRPGQGDSLGEVRALKVQMFANQTFKPYLENVMTNAITQRFLRTRRWRLVEISDQADALFAGTVVAYRSDPVSFDSKDNVLEYRAEMTVAGELRSQEDGKVLWKGKLTWNEEYPSSLDKAQQADEEEATIGRIAERLAEEFYFRLTDNF